ncbi:BQ2448_7654 [Microbotryum intermedium]|uniref:BQ2448_7654 protein n=1 Tax=Microbotryum intermedium TaxID=269621 RepID=A0A238FN73_9BASI|nr:BQ2448_7654 [Microbotryum intermedium]
MTSPQPRQQPPRIKLPPVPASALPQTVLPTPLSRGLQLGAFALATGITFYAVLIYDFGQKEHCFMPIRRWFDAQTSGLFTLSDRERAAFDPRVRTTPLPGAVGHESAVKPDRRTPIEYFKERENERST